MLQLPSGRGPLLSTDTRKEDLQLEMYLFVTQTTYRL